MSQYSDALLEAFQILTDYATVNSTNSKTIEAKIIELEDAEKKAYKVDYMNNKFTVYSTSTEVFSEGDLVYVLVPEGNFDKTKVIIGLSVYSDEEEARQQQIIQEIRKAISGNLVLSPASCIFKDALNKKETISFNEEAVKSYSRVCKNFSFSFKVKTDIQKEYRYGKNTYGAIVEYETKIEGQESIPAKKKELSFTVDSMNGYPYGYDDFTLQSQPILLENNEIITNITGYFFYNFQDAKAGTCTVSIEQPVFQAEKVITKELASKGTQLMIFTNNIYYTGYESKTTMIHAKLFTNSLEIRAASAKYYWFEEDPRITTYSEGYDSKGGVGWRLLSENLDLASLEYPIYKAAAAQRIKCVALYKDIPYEDIIELYNNTKNVSLAVSTKPFDEGYSNKYLQNSEYVTLYYQLDDTLNEDFLVSYCYKDLEGKELCTLSEDGQHPILDDSGQVTLRINNLDYFSFTYTIFKDDEVYVTNTLDFSSEQEVKPQEDYTLTIVNDDIVYTYDANGISPCHRAYSYLGLNQPPMEITPLSFILYDNIEGKQINQRELSSSDISWRISEGGMFSSSSASNVFSFGYKIADKYDIAKVSKSYIELTVKYKNRELTQKAKINFTKTGLQGTNGTRYCALWKEGFNPRTALWVSEGDENIGFIHPNIEVYKDTDKIADGSTLYTEGKIKINISHLDKDISEINDELDIITDTRKEMLKGGYLIYEIHIDEEYLYLYVPINRLFSDDDKRRYNFDGHYEIIYNKEGYDPQYEKSVPTAPNFSEDTNAAVKLSPFVGIPDKITSDEVYYIFYNEETGEEYLYLPLVLRYNRYEMDRTNAWDGVKTQVNDGYIIAPQVIAGSKDGDNSFTGVVIGQKETTDKKKKIENGMFAFAKGVQTVKIDATDGSAVFGQADTGQIILNPGKAPTISFTATSGKIYSGAHNVIDSEADGFYLSYDGLSIGSKFKIDEDGSGYFDGEIISESGKIGGWEITEDSLMNDSIIVAEDKSRYKALISTKNGVNDYFLKFSKPISVKTTDTDGNETNSDIDIDYFYVNNDGKMYARNADIEGKISSADANISGKITAKTGKIGTWEVLENGTLTSEYSNDGHPALFTKIALQNDGSIVSYRRATRKDGTVYDQPSAAIQNDGTIAVYGTPAEGGGTTSNPLATMNYTGGLTAYSGNIGGWTINRTEITSGNTHLYSTGEITSDNCSFTGGQIGGWKIDGKKLYAEDDSQETEKVQLIAGSVKIGRNAININGDIEISSVGPKGGSKGQIRIILTDTHEILITEEGFEDWRQNEEIGNWFVYDKTPWSTIFNL